MADALFQEVNFHTGLKKDRNPSLSEQHSQAELDEQNHMSCQLHIFTAGLPTIHFWGLRSRPFLKEPVCDSWHTGQIWRTAKIFQLQTEKRGQGRISPSSSEPSVYVWMWQVTKPEPGLIRSIQLMLSSVLIHLQSVSLYSTRSPLAQGYNLLSIASKRINIPILWAHMYPNSGDKGITFVISL